MTKKKKWLIGIGVFLLALVLAGVLLWKNWPRLVAGDLGGGTPWIDSDLIENIKTNMTTSAKDDFHLWANYDQLREMEIPTGLPEYGAFVAVQIETNQKAAALIDDPEIQGHDADLIRALYHAYLDWDERDAAGLEPLRATIEDIEGISSMEELDRFLCDSERSYGVPVLISFENIPSLNDSSRYITTVTPDVFLLGDTEEYENRSIEGIVADYYYRFELTKHMQRLGYTGAKVREMLKQALSLEGQIAPVCMTDDEILSPDSQRKTNNEYSMSEAAALAPNYPLERLLASRGYGATEKLRITQPAHLARLGELYTAENLEAIKSRMIVYYVLVQASTMDRKAVELERTLKNLVNGVSGRRSDEEYAYDNVCSLLHEPLDRCYLEKYNARQAKERITELCYEIMDYYRGILSECEWLSEETRAAAINKLEHITVNVAYPDKWHDYSDLELSGLSYRDCLKKISFFKAAEDAAKTNQTVDRDYWDFDILETNACYYPPDNSINIYLGIIGGEFYYDGMSDEELLSGIGSVIGHEISHAFDTSGAQFDEEGNLKNWWTEDDYSAFTARAKRLAEYYDAIRPVEKLSVKGRIVQGEAIADIAGMKCMLSLAKTRPDFDYKKFFTHYARIWSCLCSVQNEYMKLQADPHPLPYLRTNVTVQQFDEFLDAFEIQPGDNMYLAPEDRITVW